MDDWNGIRKIKVVTTNGKDLTGELCRFDLFRADDGAEHVELEIETEDGQTVCYTADEIKSIEVIG